MRPFVVRLLAFGSLVTYGVVSIAACGDDDSGSGAVPDGGSPDTSVADATSPTSDGSSTDSAADTGGPPTCANGADEIVLSASADTTMTMGCNGTICYGAVDAVQVGKAKADSAFWTQGLLRFAIAPAQSSIVFGSGVVSAKLVLHSLPDCEQCGSAGLPAREDTLLTYPMRSDWVELETHQNCGVDRCRRTSGDNPLGWGANPVAASNNTAIEKGVDFASTAVMTPFASNASSVEVALSAAHLTAFAPPNKDAVSFYFEIAKSGVFVFASKEVKADAGVKSAELHVTHCK